MRRKPADQPLLSSLCTPDQILEDTRSVHATLQSREPTILSILEKIGPIDTIKVPNRKLLSLQPERWGWCSSSSPATQGRVYAYENGPVLIVFFFTERAPVMLVARSSLAGTILLLTE